MATPRPGRRVRGSRTGRPIMAALDLLGQALGRECLQRLNNPAVKDTAPLLEEAAVGHLVREGVLEGVFDLGEEACFVEELGGLQAAEPAAQLALEARAQKGDAGFWDAHDKLFQAPALDDSDLAAVAQAAGLDPKKALAEFAAAPSQPLAFVETARIQRANDKNDDARKSLTKALELDPDLPVAHVELGILDKLDGKVDAAPMIRSRPARMSAASNASSTCGRVRASSCCCCISGPKGRTGPDSERWPAPPSPPRWSSTRAATAIGQPLAGSISVVSQSAPRGLLLRDLRWLLL